MKEQNSIQDIFFKFLMEYKYDEKDLDYSLVEKHISVLQTLSAIGNSGFNLFDIHKRQVRAIPGFMCAVALQIKT